MADKVGEFIAASDNASDYADKQVDDLYDDALGDIDELMRNPDSRDEDLWDELDVDPEATVKDYDETPRDDRDLDWVIGFSGLTAAASLQFFLTNREYYVIRPLAYREQVLDPFTLTERQLIQAGKRGVELATTAQYEALKKTYIDDLSFLKKVDDKVLYQILQDNGALRSIDKMIAEQARYVARMTDYAPNSTQFKEAVSQLVDVNSKDGMRRQSRRSLQRLYMQRETQGDENVRLVWIVEGGSSTCTYCQDNAGVIMTLADWEESGLPGAEVCAGADRCRCQLAKAA